MVDLGMARSRWWCFFFSAKSLFLSVLTLSRLRLAPELGWVHGLIWAWWWAGIGMDRSFDGGFDGRSVWIG